MLREGLVSVAASSARWAAHDTAGEAIELRDLTAWKSQSTGSESPLGSPIAETTIAGDCGGLPSTFSADRSQVRGVCVFSRRGALGSDDTAKCNVHVVMATEHEILRTPSFDRELADSEDDESDTLEDYSGEGSSPIFINPDGSIDVDFSDDEAEELEDFISLLTEPIPSAGEMCEDECNVNNPNRSSPRRTWQRPMSLNPFRDDLETFLDNYNSEGLELDSQTESNENILDLNLNRLPRGMHLSSSTQSSPISTTDNGFSARRKNWSSSCWSSSADTDRSNVQYQRTDCPDEDNRLRGGTTAPLRCNGNKFMQRSDNVTDRIMPNRMITSVNLLRQNHLVQTSKKSRCEKDSVNVRHRKDIISSDKVKIMPNGRRQAFNSRSGIPTDAGLAGNDGRLSNKTDFGGPNKLRKWNNNYNNNNSGKFDTDDQFDGNRRVTNMKSYTVTKEEPAECNRCTALTKAIRMASVCKESKAIRLPFAPKKSISIEDAILNLTQENVPSQCATDSEQPSSIFRRSSSTNRLTEKLRFKLGLDNCKIAAGCDHPIINMPQSKSAHTTRRPPFSRLQQTQCHSMPSSAPSLGPYSTSPGPSAFAMKSTSFHQSPTLSKESLLNPSHFEVHRRHSDTCSSLASTSSKCPLACSRCLASCTKSEGTFVCNNCAGVQRIKSAFVLELYADRPSMSVSSNSHLPNGTCYGIRIGIGILPLLVALVSLFLCCSLFLLAEAPLPSPFKSESSMSGQTTASPPPGHTWKWLD